MRKKIQIINAIRKGKNTFSKKDIQQETGMVWGTICKTVASLLNDGFIFARRAKPTRPGRPKIPLCIESNAAYFVGLDIGASETKAVVCNLAFNAVYHSSTATPKYSDEATFFAWLFDFFDTILADSRIPWEKLVGIGLAVSGTMDSEQGIIISGGNFGIKRGTNLPVGKKFSAHSGVPVLAMGTQTAAVWAEYHFGLRAGCGNLVTIGLGVGIGSGVVVNHHLLISQPGQTIGYIGHLLIPGNKYVCTCGFRGCLEAYSGGNFLAAVAAEKIPNRPELYSAEALDRAAAAGDPAAVDIMTTAASYNAAGIASMIQLYSPDALIFSGGQTREKGFLFNRTLAALNDVMPLERRKNFTVDISNLGKYQSALGAAQLAFEKFF